NFFDLGGDSILSIQVVARANHAGLRLSPRQFFQHQTIASLAAVANTAPAVEAEQGLVTGPLPLTPIQRWVMEGNPPDPHHFNFSVLLEVRGSADPVPFATAFRRLLAHHDALRLRFVQEDGDWRQQGVGMDTEVDVVRVDLSRLPEAEQPA